MNREHGGLSDSADHTFVQLVLMGVEAISAMRQTPEAQKAIQNRNDLARSILEAAEQSETIEELIHCEVVLQQLDEHSAHDPQDLTSIRNAQRDYRQLMETVAQMRRNPEEYLRANMGFGDVRELPRGRIQQVLSNLTRLRNRAAFSPEEERQIWDARIRLAEKTAEMLRGMHRFCVEEYETKILP
jgi:hypothetical protein